MVTMEMMDIHFARLVLASHMDQRLPQAISLVVD